MNFQNLKMLQYTREYAQVKALISLIRKGNYISTEKILRKLLKIPIFFIISFLFLNNSNQIDAFFNLPLDKR